MEWWRAALWGLAGAACVELWNLHLITRQPVFSWRRPVPQGLSASVTAVLTRLAVGTVVAAAASDEVRGVWITFGVGIAAPVLLQRLASEIPLTGGEELSRRLTADTHRPASSGHSVGVSDDDDRATRSMEWKHCRRGQLLMRKV